MKEGFRDSVHLFTAFSLLGIIKDGTRCHRVDNQADGVWEGIFEQSFQSVLLDLSKKRRNRLSGTPFSVQFGKLGGAFLALERGETDNDSSKVQKLGISDHFSDSFEKTLAKRRKSMYAER